MEQGLQFSEIAGYYQPSFFRMHIDIDKKIERIEDLNVNDFSTLMHEYVHFIQDITTIYGLGNIYNSVQYIKYATNIIYQSGETFNVPIKPDNENQNGSLINFANYLQGKTEGDYKKYNGQLFKIEKKNIPLNKHLNIKSLPTYNLKINDKGAITYRFGAICIMESMAYLLEECLSGVDARLPDYPYNSAKQVSAYYYKKFSSNKLRLLALCDISLNSSNPANTFIELLNRWKKMKYLPNNARDLYDYIYNEYPFLLSRESPLGITKQKVRYENQFNEYVKLARESLHDYFVNEKTDENNEFTRAVLLINQWIDEIMNSASKWRKHHPHFIIDIAEGGTKDRKAISELFNEFGLPFCTNANYEGCYYHPKVNSSELPLHLFMVAGQISKIFAGHPNKCCLFDFCFKCKNLNLSDIEPNLKCLSPWMRHDDKKLCPFALVWNHWNLKGQRPFDGVNFF